MKRDCNILHAVTITQPENLAIGERVSIHPYCYFAGSGKIEIGDFTGIANHVTFVSEIHNNHDVHQMLKLQGTRPLPIKIGVDCWIGSQSIILGGTELGRGVVICAGSVVSGKIPDYSVVIGNPARVISNRLKKYNQELEKKVLLNIPPENPL